MELIASLLPTWYPSGLGPAPDWQAWLCLLIVTAWGLGVFGLASARSARRHRRRP